MNREREREREHDGSQLVDKGNTARLIYQHDGWLSLIRFLILYSTKVILNLKYTLSI